MNLPKNPEIGIIGGSGVYDLPELTKREWRRVASSFGEPSDDLLFGEVFGVRVVFLPRHGRGHKIPPSQINYRANIDALKRCGVQEVISISAVGSLLDECPPGMFVLVDQYIDRTISRENSFFGPGCVAHVSMAEPVCHGLKALIYDAAIRLNIPCRPSGTYLAMEGPQFSTFAESNLYRSWGAHVIGMTNMPEARLAREAELCYASICMVTDYDCWHPKHENVSVEEVVRVMSENSRVVQKLIADVLPKIPSAPDRLSWNGRRSLENAVITAPEARDSDLCLQLDAIAGRVLRPK